MNWAAFLLLALSGCGGCATVAPTHADMRASALRLEFVDGQCSGTAIGPDLILSAKHCFGGALRTVNGQKAEVVSSHAESMDTIVVRIKGVTFKRWAERGPKPSQGDTLIFWGNPEGIPDVMRTALVSRAWTDGLILQTIVCGGDSGSGLFNAKGQVVGIISAVTGDRICKFGLSL